MSELRFPHDLCWSATEENPQKIYVICAKCGYRRDLKARFPISSGFEEIWGEWNRFCKTISNSTDNWLCYHIYVEMKQDVDLEEVCKELKELGDVEVWCHPEQGDKHLVVDVYITFHIYRAIGILNSYGIENLETIYLSKENRTVQKEILEKFQGVKE